MCDQAKAVRRLKGVWEKIQDLLEADQLGSVMLEEIINRGEQIYDLKLGFAKLLLTS